MYRLIVHPNGLLLQAVVAGAGGSLLGVSDARKDGAPDGY